MGASEGVTDEISRLLFSSFQGHPGVSFSKSDISRMWSLEMQWFSPGYSSSLVDRLHSQGWLVGTPEALLPLPGFDLLPPPLGWQPFLARPEEIPPSSVANIAEYEAKESPVTVRDNTPPPSVDDGISPDMAQPMISLVSRRSGLERREVVRRAQRKRRALGPVTLVMALALLAREQSLDMHEVMELIAPGPHSRS